MKIDVVLASHNELLSSITRSITGEIISSDGEESGIKIDPTKMAAGKYYHEENVTYILRGGYYRG